MYKRQGSYRFEIKYTEPEGVKVGAKQPSALRAMSRAIEMISNLKSPYDLDKTAERTTYTVGVGNCTKAETGMRSQSCTLMVDMRSPTQEPLSAMRAKIEPTFKKALDEENGLFKVKDDNAKAVKMELVWFGDRPAHQRKHYSDGVMQAYWQSAKVVGIDERKELNTRAASLNDNVPAAVGVPTVNINVGTNAGGGGGHAWYEWGIPGNGVDEGKRVYRMILMGLMASGYNTSAGKKVDPLMGPIGSRTTEDMY